MTDIPLFEWHELSIELLSMSNGESSDSAGVTAEILRYLLFEGREILLGISG